MGLKWCIVEWYIYNIVYVYLLLFLYTQLIYRCIVSNIVSFNMNIRIITHNKSVNMNTLNTILSY